MPLSHAPEILKGAFVRMDSPSGQQRVIAFQYNPEKLFRLIDEAAHSGGGASPTEPPREVIRCTLELDAGDALEQPDENPDVVAYGIHPALSALESLMDPPAASRPPSFWERLFGGAMDPLPVTLFRWGPVRAVPVRLTRLTITETLHDPRLNPIQASVNIAMQVLREADFPRGHWGRDAVTHSKAARDDLARRHGA